MNKMTKKKYIALYFSNMWFYIFLKIFLIPELI